MNPNIKTAETSPQVYARIGGVLYLILILAGVFGEIFVRNKLIISGDEEATAHAIMNHQSLWRLGIATDLVMHILDIPIMLVIYVLLRPVNRNLALLVLLFNVVQTAVLVANKLNLISALLPLENQAYLTTPDAHLIYAQVYLSLRLHNYGFGVGLIFFGFVCLIEGYLIFKSQFLPKTIGVLLQIAGVCYLTNSFALILAPKIAHALFPVILLPSFIAELSFALWLIVKGVNVAKWKAWQNLG